MSRTQNPRRGDVSLQIAIAARQPTVRGRPARRGTPGRETHQSVSTCGAPVTYWRWSARTITPVALASERPVGRSCQRRGAPRLRAAAAALRSGRTEPLRRAGHPARGVSSFRESATTTPSYARWCAPVRRDALVLAAGLRARAEPQEATTHLSAFPPSEGTATLCSRPVRTVPSAATAVSY